PTFAKSSILKKLKLGKYRAACDSLLKYKYVAKRDCSVRSNGCYGVWTRQLERHAKCIGAQ
ncbi:lysozyme, partial [Acinetobacter baumannii]|nr:lysozyme [Acinetobacter baumannii]